MIVKSIIWDLEYKPRGSGKTSELLRIAEDSHNKSKKTLFITTNHSFTNTIRELTNGKVHVVGSHGTSGISFDHFDVVLLDEFDSYEQINQANIIAKLQSCKNDNFLVVGRSTRRAPRKLLFSDLVK